MVEYARAFLAGLAAQGVVGCGKHFPGWAAGRSIRIWRRRRFGAPGSEIWREDLAPYRELRDELPMVMVNHAAYPETPGKERPASVSQFWITTVLRKRIGYRGIVFSDDLEMGGILKFMPIEEARSRRCARGWIAGDLPQSGADSASYEALIAEGERSAAFRQAAA